MYLAASAVTTWHNNTMAPSAARCVDSSHHIDVRLGAAEGQQDLSPNKRHTSLRKTKNPKKRTKKETKQKLALETKMTRAKAAAAAANNKEHLLCVVELRDNLDNILVCKFNRDYLSTACNNQLDTERGASASGIYYSHRHRCRRGCTFSTATAWQQHISTPLTLM